MEMEYGYIRKWRFGDGDMETMPDARCPMPGLPGGAHGPRSTAPGVGVGCCRVGCCLADG
jgi:hypothetical protein